MKHPTTESRSERAASPEGAPVSACGCHATAASTAVSTSRALRRVLVAVLVINLPLFAGELAAGWWAASSALQADALDSLGDAGVYALSLYVVGRTMRWQAGAAAVKGVVQGLFGLAVLVEVVRRLLGESIPTAPVMAGVAAIALVANLVCFLLLWRFRDANLNMQSVWLCSRNDLVNNVSVIMAAGAVAWVCNGIPDALVGTLIAALFLRTSYGVLQQAGRQWRAANVPVTAV